MDRKKFLTRTATLGAGLITLKACGDSQSANGQSPAVHTRKKEMWRLASSFPRSLDTIFGVADTFSQRVSDLTDGQFQIHVSPAGELVPALQVMDAVQQGTVPIGHTASYYFKGKNPSLAFDCTVPFGLTARQQNAWMQFGGGKELISEVFSDFGIVPLQGGNTGSQMGGWFRREIAGLADLAGLKMRIPGFGGEVMSRMGVTVQVLGGPDIYPALERGAIDATEWVGPYDDEILGFHQVAKHYYYPGWWEPGPQLSFLVNAKKWESLPKQFRDALTVASAEANTEMLANYDAKNPPALKRLKEKGIVLHAFDQEIMNAAHGHTRDILEELASGDPAYKKVYDSWRTFKDESDAWFATSELAYNQFAFK